MEEKTPVKKKLSFALQYLLGIGDAGFVLMSHDETFYFMRFLTTLANFTAPVAALINSVFSIIDAVLSWSTAPSSTAPRPRSGAATAPG